MAHRTLLDYLRSRSMVDCDTLDVSVAEELGPFQDSTSNQAIAYFELQNQRHEQLIQNALTLSLKLSGMQNVSQAVDIAMTMLALRMLPHLKGTTHIQVNPLFSDSTTDIVNNARSIVSYAQAIEPTVDVSRLCIKIPSTWAGLQACRILESEGIKTLGTILFCPAQAALAAQAGCSYIAPYVNELRVHFDSGFKDPDPGFPVVAWAQAYYKLHGYKTQVMPASLTSVDEVMKLAGSNHITVAPTLLMQCHNTPEGENIKQEQPSVFDANLEPPKFQLESIKDEASFVKALIEVGNGKAERKLREAIQIFCDFQQNLEKMFADALVKLKQ